MLKTGKRKLTYQLSLGYATPASTAIPKYVAPNTNIEFRYHADVLRLSSAKANSQATSIAELELSFISDAYQARQTQKTKVIRPKPPPKATDEDMRKVIIPASY
ncbi:MAG: hypothetical protein M1840_007861 [Geoglossum simile]|nr:MAG: hypothetical protein M1840_007861 [Geoglossum simile]